MTYCVGVTLRTTAGRPHLRGVVTDSSGVFVRSFQHQASSGDDHEMLHAIGQALTTELAVQPVESVIIREGGFARATGLTAAVKNRLRAEGVALAAARAVTRRVAVTDSKGVAQLLGVDVGTADAQGAALAGATYQDPASAALAAAAL